MNYFKQQIEEKQRELAELQAQKALYDFSIENELFYDENKTYVEVVQGWRRSSYRHFEMRLEDLIELELRPASEMKKLQKIIKKLKSFEFQHA